MGTPLQRGRGVIACAPGEVHFLRSFIQGSIKVVETRHHAAPDWGPWAWGPPLVALVGLVAIALSGTNRALFLWLNGASAVTGDTLWAQFNILGDSLVAAVLLLPLVRKHPGVVWAAALAAVLAMLWSRGLKALWDIPRPPAVLPREMFHIIGPTLHRSAFPSGHATTIFTVCGTLALAARSVPLRWLLLALALFVSAARGVAGVHWPADLLGGMFGGWLAAVGGHLWARHWRWGVTTPGRWTLTAGLLAGAALLLVRHDTGFPQALVLQRIVALTCLLWGAAAALRSTHKFPPAAWRGRGGSRSLAAELHRYRGTAFDGTAGVDDQDPQDLDARVARLVEDLARHEEARGEILRLGRQAGPSLDRYLAGPPQSIPHARVFAVQLLGALPGDEAAEALRRVLFRHDLGALDPVLAQSEYVVKNEAVEQLLRRRDAEFADDFLRALRVDRLPAATRAVACLRLTAVLPDLIQALEDDVLSVHAADALAKFGRSAVPALADTLGEIRSASRGGGESRVSRQRRMLAAMTLGRIGETSVLPPLHDMMRDTHPSVAASAALASWRLDPAGPSPEQARLLVQGALSPEEWVGMGCREAVRAIGRPCVAAAFEALAMPTAADLYGVSVQVRAGACVWLVGFILELFEGESSRLQRALAACVPRIPDRRPRLGARPGGRPEHRLTERAPRCPGPPCGGRGPRPPGQPAGGERAGRPTRGPEPRGAKGRRPGAGA